MRCNATLNGHLTVWHAHIFSTFKVIYLSIRVQYANASMYLYATAPAFFCCEHYMEGIKMILRCRKVAKVTEKLWGMRPVTLHCNVVSLAFRDLLGLSHFQCTVIHSEHPVNNKWDLRKCCQYVTDSTSCMRCKSK